MPRTAREYCISIILIGVMLVVISLLVPIFGPQPLANPIAAGILLTVVIVCCCLLSMNRVILAKLKTTKDSKKDSNIICPYCHTRLKPNTSLCPKCGNLI